MIESVSVKNFRSHTEYSIAVSPGVTVILGGNGSGKTSLLEAVYIALRGKSFRGVDRDIVRVGSSWYRIDVVIDEMQRTVRCRDEESFKKQFEIDGKKTARLAPPHRLPVVLFEPDDLRMITGSPSRRRHFLDTFISQYDPKYATALGRYERALLQRNKALKHPGVTRDTIFVWDVALSEYGAYIAATRSQLIEDINQQITPIYRQIAGTTDNISLAYSSTSGNTPGHYLRRLTAEYERDVVVGSTSVGPHRHDMIVGFNGKPAADVCSRGEIRTIHLALKFIEAKLIEQYNSVRPLILLDDVFGELDASRQKRLISEFTDHQIIITSATKSGHIPRRSTVVVLD